MLLILSVGIYYQITGLYPISIFNKSESILPSEADYENQTYAQVLDFMKKDDTDTSAYRQGFNCVDAVFRVFLNARWQGISACPISIEYDAPPGHMIIGFNTEDRGSVFFETLNDMQVRPRVGALYNDRKIRGFYYMDVKWIPLENSPESNSQNVMEPSK